MHKNIFIPILFAVIIFGAVYFLFGRKAEMPKEEDKEATYEVTPGPKTEEKLEGVVEPVKIEEKEVTTRQSFGQSVLFRPGDYTVFKDGLKVTLTNIYDSRCKEGVQCIWAGELGANFVIGGGKVVEEQSIYLGTVRSPKDTFVSYSLTLVAITETTATVVVEVVE